MKEGAEGDVIKRVKSHKECLSNKTNLLISDYLNEHLIFYLLSHLHFVNKMQISRLHDIEGQHLSTHSYSN